MGASDWANTRWAMPGRLWAHFISLFVNAAEGTSYGIVPYMIPQHLAVVSAVVGAGGTLGAVIATWSFYKYVEDDLLPFKLHGLYVAFWALTCFLMRWDHLGSMFGGPKTSAANEGEPKSVENPASAGDLKPLEDPPSAANEEEPKFVEDPPSQAIQFRLCHQRLVSSFVA